MGVRSDRARGPHRPLVCALLPRMVASPLEGWLRGVGLSGWSFRTFVFSYGLVHPPLEQAHWASLRRAGRLRGAVHLAFKAYHGLVLREFMHWEWWVPCLAIVACASLAWGWLDARLEKGFAVPACAHLVADLGLILAIWARMSGW